MKRKMFSILYFIPLLLLGCYSQSPKPVDTPAPTYTNVPVSTTTPSPLPTLVVIPTPLEATKIPTPLCDDQNPGDLAAEGEPKSPSSVRGGTLDLQKIVSDREAEFNIFKQTIHNRIVTVAIPKSLKLTESEMQDYTKFVFRTWSISWKELGGFPFSSYTLIAGSDALQGISGSYTGGNGAIIQNTRTAWASHEIFHAWLGGTFTQSDGTDWFIEGVTTYYGDTRLQNEAPYQDRMREFVMNYLNYYQEGKDRILANEKTTSPSYDHNFIAQKGAVLAYALDLELQKYGHHLGQVIKFLYLRYGTQPQGWITNKEILEAFNQVSGTDFTDFFKNYIYNKELLPISENSTYKWVCHD